MKYALSFPALVWADASAQTSAPTALAEGAVYVPAEQLKTRQQWRVIALQPR